VKVCNTYGAGFFFIPGTDTCLKIGGYVRIEYDNRAKVSAGRAAEGVFAAADDAGGTTQTGTDALALSTAGWYTRGTISADARTSTSLGTVQSYIQARVVQSGSGTMSQDSASSIEAAYIRFAGFTFGQARQPYAFMSSWGYMSNWWTGWPNGVRQISYTQVMGGGLSATVSVQDANSNASGHGYNNASSEQSWDYNGPVYIGSVNYDQSWGRLQVMGAYTGKQEARSTSTNALTALENGYSIGIGAAFKLDQIGKGDSIEFTANYWDGLAKLGIGNANLQTPSSGSWGPVSPLASLNVATSSGWSVGSQFQHYFSPQWRAVVFGAYADMNLNDANNRTATAVSTGAQLVWSPVRQFDIGVQALYVRAERKNADGTSSLKSDNVGMKVRVQRGF